MIKRIAFTFFTKFSGAVLNFLILILLSQVLGTDGRGTCSLILSTIAIFAIITDIMGGPSLVYLVPRFQLKSLLLPAYVWIAMVCGLFYIILQYYPVIPPTYVSFVLLLSVMNSVTATHLNILLGQERTTVFNVAGLTQSFTIFGALASLFFIKEQPHVSSYLLALFIGFGSALLMTTFAVYRRIEHRPLANNALQEMVKVGLSNQLAMLAQFISYRIGFYFLNELKDTSSVGIYSNAVSIAEAIWLTGHAISTILYARIANLTDDKTSGEITVKLARLNLLLTLTLVIPVAFIPDSFYLFMFGKDFTGVSTLIQILLPGILIFSMNMVCSNYFAGTGRYFINTMASLLGMVFTLMGSYLLIPDYGTKGAALAATASYTVTTLFTVSYFIRSTPHTLKDLIPSKEEIYSGLRMLNFGNR